ncbi:hypothetical protein TrLO_g10108 [Triparma laevis f. longispina]|uniref:EngB-type G domain-containing protein n=1 Tax=Triparma laevis f. longispina TaxID=1714387 RepID=A0A9W7AEQ2_9STRA|nr:hypothetical protein TrLO_g10108 [Triparma laevis f. longispina]
MHRSFIITSSRICALHRLTSLRPLSSSTPSNLPEVDQPLYSWLSKLHLGIPPRKQHTKSKSVRRPSNKKGAFIPSEKQKYIKPPTSSPLSSPLSSPPPPPFLHTSTRKITRTQKQPPGTLPEIALIGRSNVGKSSLLNALLYSNSLYNPGEKEVMKNTRLKNKTPFGHKLPPGVKAIISDKPGETKNLNYYTLKDGDKSLRVVDCPGFGFNVGGLELEEDVREYLESGR